MSAVKYKDILKYRLMIPMYPEVETCLICRKACPYTPLQIGVVEREHKHLLTHRFISRLLCFSLR
ncbi:hypothetical protein Hanom_Chr17g01532641 [Helianthus anomalus]